MLLNDKCCIVKAVHRKNMSSRKIAIKTARAQTGRVPAVLKKTVVSFVIKLAF